MGIFSNSSNNDGALEEFYSRFIGKFLATKTGGNFASDKNDVTDIAAMGGSVSGGYSALEEYGNSVYSSAKEKLIRGIAKDVSSMLKVTSSYAETADIKDVVSKLQRIVPNPKHNKSIKADSAMHKDLCMALAKSINRQYDMNIIDADAEPSIICNKVSEIMYSLFTGLHSEFLTISGDVSRILKNLQILQEFVDSANKKLIQNLENSNGAEDGETESIKALYTKLSEEIDRQHAILANLTDSVIGPVGESLITILEENDDFAELTTDLKKMTGTPEFGNKLGYLLSGTSGIASAAAIVDKALKKIGMSVAEYKSVHGLRELREKVYNSMVKQKPSSDELYKLLVAADLLYKNDMAHDDIAAYLEKKKGGVAGGAFFKLDDSYSDAAALATDMTTTDSPLKGRPQSAKKSVVKQISEQQQLRKHLFMTLNLKIKADYDKIKLSLASIGRKIGGEIDLTPELDMFVKQLNNFSESQPDRQNIHIALSGYRTDITSLFVKYQFMENLYAISETAGVLTSGKGGHIFKDVKDSVDALIKAVDEFNSTFLNTITEVHIKSLGAKRGGSFTSDVQDLYSRMPSMASAFKGGVQIDKFAETLNGGSECTDDEKKEGGDCGCTGGMDDESMAEPVRDLDQEDQEFEGNSTDAEKQIYHTLGGVVERIADVEFNHFKTMKRAIREIDYYYRIAGVKHNMNVTAGEYANNTENYENILGEEAGYTIDQIQKKYNDLISAIESEDTPAGATMDVTKLYANDKTLPAVVPGFGLDKKLAVELAAFKRADAETKKVVEKYEGGYKFLLEYLRSSKVEMLEAAQSLDLYLSKFTQSIQLKPDQIKEFVQVLEQIEIVAKWFTDKSGDNLVGVFESFSSIPIPIPIPIQNNAINQAFPTNPIADFADLAPAVDATIGNHLTDSAYTINGAHYYDKVAAADGPRPAFTAGKFYQPRMMTREQAINFVKQIEKSIKSVRALENIIATFSRVNTSVSADVKSFMSSGMMFKAFMKYCVASVISVGYLTFDAPNTIPNDFIVSAAKSVHAKMAVGLRFNNDAIRWQGNRYLELCDPLSIYSVQTPSSIIKNVDVCDNIYEMSIKAMIAKVFTIVGSYTLFNRPAKDQVNSLSMANNPLRQILGGSKGGAEHANIITEATELYVRLPLLVEWYRTVFDFKGDATPGNRQTNPIISMIPDMDSVFGPLCKVIFLDASNIVDGAYPAEYAHKIIDSITTIYKHFSIKKAGISTREILSEFVLEINRRYGFIMRDEIKAYLNEREEYINADEAYPDDDRVDYDLLDVDAGMGRRPAPSDKFRSFSKQKSTRKYDVQDLLKSAKRFRQSIEDNLQLTNINLGLGGAVRPLENADFRTIANVSLTGIIAQTKRKIENLKLADEKYMVVHEQLHGIEKFGDLDQQKMILFHETVITPLTVLYFTYLILNDYNKFCVSLNPGEPLEVPNARFTALNLFNKCLNKFKGTGNKYKTKNEENIVGGVLEDVYYNDSMYRADDYVGLINAASLTRQNSFTDLTMETLLRKAMNVGCDMNGLTELYFVGSNSADTYPVLNYDKLEEMCTELFNNAKLAMHQLRKFMPISLIKKYESVANDANTSENRISLFYLQEQLFERLFKNKYGNGLTDATIGMKNIYLTMTRNYADAPADNSKSFSKVFSKIGFWDVTSNNSSINTIINNDQIRTQNGGNKFNELKFGDANSLFPMAYSPIFKSGSTYSNMSREDEKIMFGVTQPNNADAKSNRIDDNQVIKVKYGNDTKIFVGTKNLYDLDDSKTNPNHTELGLIPKLNGIIYKYCNIFIDKSSKKIYKTLIEKFVNGHNAKDILNGKNINDNVFYCSVEAAANGVYLEGTVFSAGVCRTEPMPNAVLFASIANGLKGLALAQSEKLTGTGAAFIEDNFLNVSEYQKELMRANLPAFEKELNLLIKKSEFMKRCLEETHTQVVAVAVVEPPPVVLNADAVPAVPAVPADDANGVRAVRGVLAIGAQNILINALRGNDNNSDSTQANKLQVAEENSARKLYLIGLYDDISMSAKSLLRCVIDTQKELNDIPMYFETYNESIIDYNNRNGHLPFMPVSSITHLMNFNSFCVGNELALFNQVNFNLSLIPRITMGMGSPEFKFTYGTRGLLHYKQAPSLQYAPGVEALLDSYNNKLGGAAAFDKSKMEHITKGVVTLSRWCIDYMYHNQALDTHDWNAMRKLVLNNQRSRPVGHGAIENAVVKNLTCQTAKSGLPDYTFWGNTANIVLLSENDNFSQSIYRFMKGMDDGNQNKLSGADRKNFRIYNILDLNIVPINIHAMQREIPFVNLFNYSYTFDHMVKNFIGVSTKGKALREVGGEIPRGGVDEYEYEDAFTRRQYVLEEGRIINPEDTLVRHLIYPLGLRRADEYIHNTYRIMNGTTSSGLNRPKYLSDQLWNKVLLNSLYDSDDALRSPSKYAVFDAVEIMDDAEPFMVGYNNAAQPQLSTSLSYINSTGAITTHNNTTLSYEGFRRYQSKLVRWSEWFVQLQRVVRLLMRSQLEWVQDPVVQGSDAISEDVTEYKKNGVFSIGDYE